MMLLTISVIVLSGLAFTLFNSSDLVELENTSTKPVLMRIPTDLTPKQQRILQMAYDIAIKDGHTKPEMLQGIVYQESKAGAMKSFKVAGQRYGLKTNERYYGIAQIKLVAAKDVLKKYPQLQEQYLQTDTDEELIANLIMNEQFNLEIASKYLKMMPDDWSFDKKVAAYNKGRTGVNDVNPHTLVYVKEVKKHIKQKMTTSDGKNILVAMR